MGDTFYSAEILNPEGTQPATCSGDADRGAVEVFAGTSTHIITCTSIETYWLNLDFAAFYWGAAIWIP